MSTITAAEFTLDRGEVEALRTAAFASLLGPSRWDSIVERPPDDVDIPRTIGRAIRLANCLNRFAEALRAAEAGRVEAWMLEDPDEVRALVSLLQEVGVPYLIDWRDSLPESTPSAKEILADTQRLLTRLRAELGDA